MSKDNNDKILKRSLSTLLKRFSQTNVISQIEKEYQSSFHSVISLDKISDNHILKNIKINKNKLNKTCENINAKGYKSFLVVSSLDNNEFEIIYPRLIFYALKELNYQEVPVFIYDCNEEEMLFILANWIRNNANKEVVELSFVLSKLQNKYHYKQKDLAFLMSLSRSQITNIIRLKKMPQFVLNEVIDNHLSFGHARSLAKLNEDEMKKMIDEIYENKYSCRDVEKIIYCMKNNVDFSSIESNINKKYKCHTNINKNRISISFNNPEDLNKFIKKIMKR
ncbi:MAG: ParB/RepB/Spo0J family partition protein [Bacilli bacterium]